MAFNVVVITEPRRKLIHAKDINAYHSLRKLVLQIRKARSGLPFNRTTFLECEQPTLACNHTEACSAGYAACVRKHSAIDSARSRDLPTFYSPITPQKHTSPFTRVGTLVGAFITHPPALLHLAATNHSNLFEIRTSRAAPQSNVAFARETPQRHVCF